MPDLYATISGVPQDVQERLAGVLEMRAADARQREMLKSCLSEIEFPENAQVLEIGCAYDVVILTPHLGWPTDKMYEQFSEAAANVLLAHMDGREVPRFMHEH